MRVIHLPTSTGGNSYGLSRGERELGIQSDVLYGYSDYIGYPCDIRMPADDRLIQRIELFSNLFRKYDVFHYNYGATLFDIPGKADLMELPLLKNKKVAVTYNGCDARQKYKRVQQTQITMCKYSNCNGGICENKNVDKIKKRRIRKFNRYGAIFFSVNPDIMNFLPNDTVFLPYTIAGWNKILHMNSTENNKQLKIVHAPTNRVVKGTDAVIMAIKKINEKYPGKIELLLVENMSNEEAKKIYAEGDLVIDQLRAGWYGAFAVEVMKMGKPVMVYINEDDLHFIPPQMAKDCIESIINVNEFTIEDAIMYYMENPRELIEKREAQLEYVHRWHNPKFVASITKEKYEEVI